MLTIPSVSLQLSIADEIERLLPTHTAVCQSLAVEFLAVLKAKPIRAKILSIVEKLVTPTNAIAVSAGLVRHLQATKALRQKENESADAVAFIGLILHSLRVIAASQKATVKTIYDGVWEFVPDSDASIGTDAVAIIRDVLVVCPELRDVAVERLQNVLSFITGARVSRGVLFLISMYSHTDDLIELICDAYSSSADAGGPATAVTIVLGDGTYAQRTAATADDSPEVIVDRLRADPFFISAVAISLARICCRFPGANRQRAIEFVRGLVKTAGVDQESSRIGFALAAMEQPENDAVRRALVLSSAERFNRYIAEAQEAIALKPVRCAVQTAQRIGDRLNFRDLLGRRFDTPLRTVVPFGTKKGDLYQMTGTSDAIFCECRLVANMFDIALDFRLLNQSASDFGNVRVDLNCAGKLELIERPTGVALPAHAAEFVRFSVKVTSAEAGKVFGTITYEVNTIASSDQKLLPLATITVSPASYMRPEKIDSLLFRKKWETLEWEKKIMIGAPAASLEAFLDKVAKGAKMCVIAETDFALPFLTTNLYTKSFFGEEVLANVNVEFADGKVSGFIRLRTDSQAMAVSYTHLLQSLDKP
jgi:coatomer subunit beta